MREALGIASLPQPNVLIGLHDALGVGMPEEHGGPLTTLMDCITYLAARIAGHHCAFVWAVYAGPVAAPSVPVLKVRR